MDKNAIKKYAVWARRELISRVSQKAQQFGITGKEITDAGADSVCGRLLSTQEKTQRQALITQIKREDYEQVMEEVAYIWFNRFSALRFMEVNGYLPSHVRVFTDDENNFKPQILAEAIHLELDGLDMDKVYALKEKNDDEALFKYLLITQCNALSTILPGMFQHISDYTELLFPDNLLRSGSVLEQMISLIPEEDWQDQVQIIGWLYQYYNTEPKDKVFADLKKNIKITKENIPAATQLFTPDWIVRYMVENSLGRLWVEGHPSDELKTGWKYYLEEAKQEPEVQAQLNKIREEYKALKPEEIKCIDPCMGSGHILVYMFDVLMQIYASCGYSDRDAVRSIIENNLYGLDIDDRAAQLAYFSVMMKARQYDARFFSRKLQPHVHAICESNGLSADMVDYFVGGDAKLKKAMDSIITEMRDAKEYGSILNITPVDFDAIYARFDALYDEISMYNQPIFNDLLPLVRVARALAQKYEVVVTNPPYMGSSGMSDILNIYVKQYYPEGKADLFAAFIQRCVELTKAGCFTSLITMQAWMFLSSFEQIREKILSINTKCLIRIGYNSFPELNSQVAHACAFVLCKQRVLNYKGKYFELNTGKVTDNKENVFINCKNKNEYYLRSRDDFMLIPSMPLAFVLSDKLIEAFRGKKLNDIARPRQGLATGENNRFLRLWHECSSSNVCYHAHSIEESIQSNAKWFPYNKGGDFRKWYGNNDYVVNWENDGFEIRHFFGDNGKLKSRPQNTEAFFQESVTWSKIATDTLAFRYKPYGHIFDVAGTSFFTEHELLLYLQGLCNSCVAMKILKSISPTVNFEVGHIAALPVIENSTIEVNVNNLVRQNISISSYDWDSFETSWDFKRHPLLRGGSVVEAYSAWEQECTDRFNTLKANEEELNRIFIDIYGLQDELTPEVVDKDVTVRLADKKRDICSLISYAVGCMFGRYSLDVEGLAYAGGEWDDSKYKTLIPDRDNIIPICDDEYFEDDITGRFVKFIETVYGKETLGENLRFIADALGGSGQPKDVIRSYFLNDFYADHLKIYQKRPIYWLFDSGKKNGFKALIYMHRYAPDTLARMRTDYVHEQQARYRTAIADVEHRIDAASASERVKLTKQLAKLTGQSDEIRAYEEKIHHLADQMIRIDLDDGVKHNYAIFEDVLAKIK